MTSRGLIFCILLLFVTLGVRAGGHLNATSRVMRHLQETHDTRMMSRPSDNGYQAFIAVTDTNIIKSLQQCGVVVNCNFDGFVSATIPAYAIDAVCSLGGVGCVSLATPVSLCNDSARHQSHVDWVQDGHGLIASFTGKDVIVGVIDTGIDFNHINLCGADGRSRVVAAYLPSDTTGVPPVIGGYALPGSCYESASEIAALTADNTTSSHGTHTTGTAAGCYTGNGLYGVATEADIVACAMPSNELTDVNVANALNYIFDYADRVKKPCVVNMSLGNNYGPNDGTSFQCKTFEALSGPGRICVLSAGNDGNVPICFRKVLQGPTDTVTTLLRHSSGGLRREGYVSMWSDGLQEHRVRFVIINRETEALEYASPMLGSLPEDSVFVLSSDNDLEFAEYYTGEIIYASGLEPQFAVGGIEVTGERYHSYCDMDVTSNQSGHLLGLQYVSDEKVNLIGWTTRKTYFYTFGIDGITGGSSVGSISDMATTDSVISVGAYCTRNNYVDAQGDTITVSNAHLGDIAYFSSFGPDENGIQRPDVCAPGHSVLSSASRYNEGVNQQHWLSPVVENGVEYPYYSNMGTSMSAPVVTGTIALMLQLDPTLSVADVRRVLQQTSRRDDVVAGGDVRRWGSGKLDSWAAVDYVRRHPRLHCDVNNDGEITVADVMALINIILADTTPGKPATLTRADVNYDNEIGLADINIVINKIIHQQ